MNIAVDIDDTLTDSFDYFLPFVAEYFGAEEEELRQKNISYSNLPEEWNRREADFGKAYFDRVVADTPFKPDAAWGIENCGHSGIGSSSLPVARPIFTPTRTGRPRRNCGVAELFTTS